MSLRVRKHVTQAMINTVYFILPHFIFSIIDLFHKTIMIRFSFMLAIDLLNDISHLDCRFDELVRIFSLIGMNKGSCDVFLAKKASHS